MQEYQKSINYQLTLVFSMFLIFILNDVLVTSNLFSVLLWVTFLILGYLFILPDLIFAWRKTEFSLIPRKFSFQDKDIAKIFMGYHTFAFAGFTGILYYLSNSLNVLIYLAYLSLVITAIFAILSVLFALEIL